VDLLSTNSKTIRMKMGTTVRRENNGPWSAPTVRSDAMLADTGSSNRDTSNRSDRSDRSSRSSSDRSDRRLYSRSRNNGSNGGSDTGSPASDTKIDSSSSSNSDSDIAKKLMERRAKQGGND
jgi:hypothetical protein